jgi:hypothetical protein
MVLTIGCLGNELQVFQQQPLPTAGHEPQLPAYLGVAALGRVIKPRGSGILGPQQRNHRRGQAVVPFEKCPIVPQLLTTGGGVRVITGEELPQDLKATRIEAEVWDALLIGARH